MFGFVTIVAFFIAWNAGGWWWLIAILFGLVWLGKQGKKKEAQSLNQADPVAELGGEVTEIKSSAVAQKQNVNLDCSDDWTSQVTEVCARYSGAGYYVAELIPQRKLVNAMKSYPAPGGGRVLALIDSTVLGSATNGMVISEHGISWHNDSTTKSKKLSLSWDEMKDVSILRDGLYDIQIGDGNRFNMSGSMFNKDHAINLLREIQKLSASVNRSGSAPRYMTSVSENTAVTDVNIADYDQLISLPSIGVAEAKMILDRRASNPFATMDELADFLGLKPHKVEQLRNLVVFSQQSSPSLPSTQSPSIRTVIQSKQPAVGAPPVPMSSQPRVGRVID